MTSIERVRHSVESGIITISRFARLLGIAKTTAYHYTADGGSELRYSQVQQLFLHEDMRGVQRGILNDFLAGTGWIVTYIEANLDINGDDDIDVDDAMDACCTIAEKFAIFLREMQAIMRDRRVTPEERDTAQKFCADLMQAASRVNQIIGWIATHAPQRRKCRQLPGAALLTAGGRG